MNFKVFALVLLTVSTLYELLLDIIEYRSRENPVPENVKDVYDGETYLKWKRYSAENTLADAVFLLIEFALVFCFILFDVYSAISNSVGENFAVKIIAVTAFMSVVGLAVSSFRRYVTDMVIEEKYGFNKTSLKTFVADRIKSFVIEFVLEAGLICLFAIIHRRLGDWMIAVFSAVLFVIVLFVNFLYPKLSRIFNKFTPLEDGELKDRLTFLLEKHGYRVRAIEVMDASRRSTKSNAYFTGYGKTKTIVLYDTLISSMSDDEICAVFSHELGHGIHRDTLKNSFISFVNIVIIVVLAWLLIRYPAIYSDFGFTGEINYAFAFVLLSSCIMPFVGVVTGIISSCISRAAEYRADRQAVLEGYGDNFVSALKKLARENFANLSPSPVIVALMYSHPTISQRINAIEDFKADDKKS